MKKEIKKKDVSRILYGEKPVSLTQISKALGYKGSISGSLSKKIRYWFPTIDSWLKTNAQEKTGKKSAEKATKPAKASKQKASKNVPPRAPCNGYRQGSNYALCFDLLYQMGLKQPVSRKDLLEKYAELSGKEIKNAGYDLAVILSVREDGRFHKSADSASKTFPHYVKRVGDGMVQLVLQSKKEN